MSMVMLKLRSSEEHDDLLKKVKKMKKFTEELEEMLEECYEDEDYSFRSGSGSYRKDWDEDDMHMRGGGRYNYHRGGRM